MYYPIHHYESVVVFVLEACVQYGQFGLCAVAVCNPVVQYANGLLNKCLFVVRFICVHLISMSFDVY